MDTENEMHCQYRIKSSTFILSHKFNRGATYYVQFYAAAFDLSFNVVRLNFSLLYFVIRVLKGAVKMTCIAYLSYK